MDMGLRWYLLSNKGIDRGFVLENIVYLELIRRGFAVYVGKAGDAEIDFAVLKGDECSYYQESYNGIQSMNAIDWLLSTRPERLQLLT